MQADLSDKIASQRRQHTIVRWLWLIVVVIGGWQLLRWRGRSGLPRVDGATIIGISMIVGTMILGYVYMLRTWLEASSSAKKAIADALVEGVNLRSEARSRSVDSSAHSQSSDR